MQNPAAKRSKIDLLTCKPSTGFLSQTYQVKEFAMTMKNLTKMLFTSALAIGLSAPVFGQVNTNTTIQEGRINTNDSYQRGRDNDNATYQQGADNANRNTQRGNINTNQTGQYGGLNYNQSDQQGRFGGRP